jgi:hypothetical protein
VQPNGRRLGMRYKFINGWRSSIRNLLSNGGFKEPDLDEVIKKGKKKKKNQLIVSLASL